MSIETPLGIAIEAARAYRDRHASQLDSVQNETLREIEARLPRLADQYRELLDVNQALADVDPLRIVSTFDPDTDTLTFGTGEAVYKVKLNRADPNVPIRQLSLGSIGSYVPGADPIETDRIRQLRSRLETQLEGFYQSAHRVQRLLSELTGDTKDCRPITIVRNKLVEHPVPGEYYSFGYSSEGPVVRPMHRPGRSWVDAGLIPNATAFGAFLKGRFDSA